MGAHYLVIDWVSKRRLRRFCLYLRKLQHNNLKIHCIELGERRRKKFIILVGQKITLRFHARVARTHLGSYFFSLFGAQKS